MRYELVMGLETHVELSTNSKLFCSCSAQFGAAANEHVCPACAGMPGLLPVANRKAIELGIAASLLTNSEITREITFDKKSYFYPDLPTGYQTTQWFSPICRNGWVEIETENGIKKIGLKQIHIEEDAGKLVHDERTDTSLIDYNRAGVPLCEIVSNPDFRTADEVIAYLEKLRSLLSFAGVSDCKMQEGSMRCDVNISVRPAGSDTLGVRTEIKNMNSLSAIARAIAYEYERHTEALETGCETLVQETRRWDDGKGMTFPMREKENATDYRYFPHPDIVPVVIDEDWIDTVRQSLPEPAHQKYERYINRYALSEADARFLTGYKSLCDILESVCTHYPNVLEISTWITGELMALCKASGISEENVTVDERHFARLLHLLDEKAINRGTAKKIFAAIVKENADPDQYIEQHNLGLLSDESQITDAISQILVQNPKAVSEYQAGSEKVLGFLMGQVMRATGGKADPGRVSVLLRDALSRQ